MKPKHFAMLAAAAGGSLVIAIATYIAAIPWTDGNAGPREPMMAALSTRGADLAAIEITREKETLKLASKDGKWVLVSGEDYPVDEAKARELVLAATEARLVERKTALKDRHDLLGLGDHAAPGSQDRHHLGELVDGTGRLVQEQQRRRRAATRLDAVHLAHSRVAEHPSHHSFSVASSSLPAPPSGAGGSSSS